MATNNSLDGRNLKSTIFIDGEEYNVHAKTAESLVKKLTISVTQGDTTTDTPFDGSTDKTATITIPTKVSDLENDLTFTDSQVDATLSSTSTNPVQNKVIDSALAGKAPTSHASSATTYGTSSADNYGHAKASSTSPKANGTAAVGNEVTTFARGDHVHPLQTTISGNAGTATKLAAAKKISLTGHVTGEVSFDGSTDVSINTTVISATAGLQEKLVSGTNIKTINSQSLVGNGNIIIGGGDADRIKVKVSNDGTTQNSTISVMPSDPSGGTVGDIWFKY